LWDSPYLRTPRDTNEQTSGSGNGVALAQERSLGRLQEPQSIYRMGSDSMKAKYNLETYGYFSIHRGLDLWPKGSYGHPRASPIYRWLMNEIGDQRSDLWA